LRVFEPESTAEVLRLNLVHGSNEVILEEGENGDYWLKMFEDTRQSDVPSGARCNLVQGLPFSEIDDQVSRGYMKLRGDPIWGMSSSSLESTDLASPWEV